MSDAEDKENELANAEAAGDSGAMSETPVLDGAASEPVDEDPEATQVGVEKYVHAAFFSAGILAAYLSGKFLQAIWNKLAEVPEAVRAVPMLIQYSEEERGTLTLVIGAVLGVLLILRYYRRPAVRSWATAVASELSRVTWPSKETVTNGTIVVLVAGAIATVYIALLDRLWAYLTNLVYGA